jgi:hypothetical protein
MRVEGRRQGDIFREGVDLLKLFVVDEPAGERELRESSACRLGRRFDDALPEREALGSKRIALGLSRPIAALLANLLRFGLRVLYRLDDFGCAPRPQLRELKVKAKRFQVLFRVDIPVRRPVKKMGKRPSRAVRISGRFIFSAIASSFWNALSSRFLRAMASSISASSS